MKNKIHIIIIFLAAGAVILSVFWQNIFQQNLESRLRNSLLEEWNERRRIEEKIKTELDYKRREREFIAQLDYQRGLEEIIDAKINDIDSKTSALFGEFDSKLQSQLSRFDIQLDAYNRRLDDYSGQLKEYSIKQEGERLKSEEKIKTTIDKLNNLELSLSERLDKYALTLNEAKKHILLLREDMNKLLGEYKALKEDLQKINSVDKRIGTETKD